MSALPSIRPAAALAGILLAVLAGGCEAPTVTVRHELPAVLPVDPRQDTLDIRPVNVTADANAADMNLRADKLADSTQKRLIEGLRPWVRSSGEGTDGAVAIASDLRVGVQDRIHQRSERQGRPGQMQTVQLDSLVRKVDVRLRCAFTPAGADRPAMVVQVRRDYSSLADANVRGSLGLHRGDDPHRIPAAEAVARELAGRCAAAMAEILQPPVLEANVPLRGSLNGRAAAGVQALAAGDAQKAVAELQAAHRQAPQDPAILFDLAVAYESAGQLQQALPLYRQLVGEEETPSRDPQAEKALRRVERVLHRRQTTRPRPARPEEGVATRRD